MFITARHWALSWARWIQTTHSYTISLRSILILSSHLRVLLTSILLPSRFPTKSLCAFLDDWMCLLSLICLSYCSVFVLRNPSFTFTQASHDSITFNFIFSKLRVSCLACRAMYFKKQKYRKTKRLLRIPRWPSILYISDTNLELRG
jgi:hypothetical protein